MNFDINMSNHLALNLGDMILVLVSTIILVIVAKKYFWSYLTDYLNKRQELISNELNEAKAKHAESEKILSDYKAKIKSAHEESNEIILSAKKRSEALSAEIVEKGHKDAQHIVSRAREQIEKEKAEAVQSLQQEIVGVALTTAEKFLDETINDDKHHQMIEDFVKDLEVASWKK